MIRSNFEEYGIYDMQEILENLKSYTGYSAEELIIKFSNFYKDIIDIVQVEEYCYKNFNRLDESKYHSKLNKYMLEKRITDYNHFYKMLYIYKNKGLRLLYLMKYLSCPNNNKVYEEFLRKIEISHLNNIVCGRDVNRIILALQTNINRYDKFMYKINTLDTYNCQNIDGFSIKLGDIEYPNIDLVDTWNKGEKSSIRLTKQMKNLFY